MNSNDATVVRTAELVLLFDARNNLVLITPKQPGPTRDCVVLSGAEFEALLLPLVTVEPPADAGPLLESRSVEEIPCQ